MQQNIMVVFRVYFLTTWSIVMMNNPVVVEENGSCFFNSLCFLSSLRGWGVPLSRLSLCFVVIAIDPQTCYDCFQNFIKILETIKEIL